MFPDNNNITLAQRVVPEAGPFKLWVMSCSLYQERDPKADPPTINLIIKNDYSKTWNLDDMSIQICYGCGERKFVLTDEEFEGRIQAVIDNESRPDEPEMTREQAYEAVSEYCVSETFVRGVWGYSAIARAQEMWRRWEAIKLIVTPSITC